MMTGARTTTGMGRKRRMHPGRMKRSIHGATTWSLKNDRCRRRRRCRCRVYFRCGLVRFHDEENTGSLRSDPHPSSRGAAVDRPGTTQPRPLLLTSALLVVLRTPSTHHCRCCTVSHDSSSIRHRRSPDRSGIPSRTSSRRAQ